MTQKQNYAESIRKGAFLLEATMHEHKTTMTMDGEFCPTCGKFLKDIKEEPKPKKKKVTKDGK